MLALEHPLVAPRAPRLAPRPQVEPGAAAEAAEAAERAEHHDGDSRAAERAHGACVNASEKVYVAPSERRAESAGVSMSARTSCMTT